MTKTGISVVVVIIILLGAIGFGVYNGSTPKEEIQAIPVENINDGMDDMVQPEDTETATTSISASSTIELQ